MNVTAYLIAALLVVAALAGAYVQGRSDGGDLERKETLQRDLQQANENAAFAQRIQEGRRAKEKEWGAALASVSTDYQKRLTDAEAKTTVALNAIRSGSIRLRDPGAVEQASGNSASGIASPACRRDGSPGGELSRLASEFLWSEAARADRYTEQLAACQAALLADRK